jgi:hypothetical protein
MTCRGTREIGGKGSGFARGLPALWAGGPGRSVYASDMDESSALMGVSEIADAVAGFSGVATALRRHEESAFFSASRRVFFGDLISHSAIALFCAMAVIACIHAVGATSGVWAVWSVIWACCAMLGIVSGYRRGKRMPRAQGIEGWVGTVALAVFSALVVLQAYNVLVLRAFWPFFAALIGNLAFAFVQFARLAVPRAPSPVAKEESAVGNSASP